MTRRLLESLGVATVLATIMALLVNAVPVVGQAPDATVWGHPNLEGIWFDVYSTPFERSRDLGDRELATAEERARAGPGQNEQPGPERAWRRWPG